MERILRTRMRSQSRTLETKSFYFLGADLTIAGNLIPLILNV
jgi:hypothetical protein